MIRPIIPIRIWVVLELVPLANTLSVERVHRGSKRERVATSHRQYDQVVKFPDGANSGPTLLNEMVMKLTLSTAVSDHHIQSKRQYSLGSKTEMIIILSDGLKNT